MEPKKWWSECKKLCGVSKANINIASKLLDESQTIEDKVNLARKLILSFPLLARLTLPVIRFHP